MASPMPGVWRKPLAREDAERGHATSIVRYEPGARFSPHDHPKGEEILVLEGVFSDETGDYPAGTYFRNPEGFRHGPFSTEGCVLLVKLHQFQTDDTQPRCHRYPQRAVPAGFRQSAGAAATPTRREQVALVRWPAGEHFQTHSHFGGEEIYVISGELKDEHGSYPQGTWIRSPHMSRHAPFVDEDTLIWVKVGHLPA